MTSMLTLHGVGAPVASALFHVAYPERYPILDYRALAAAAAAATSSARPASRFATSTRRCGKTRSRTADRTSRGRAEPLIVRSQRRPPTSCLRGRERAPDRTPHRLGRHLHRRRPDLHDPRLGAGRHRAAFVDAAGRRVDRRPDRRLRWSVPVDDIARALVAEQAVSFLVSFTGRLRSRRLEFLFVPLGDVRDLTGRNTGSGAARWHAFCATTSRGSVAAMPFSGRNLAVNLVRAGPDAQPAAEALDLLMSSVHHLIWSDA